MQRKRHPLPPCTYYDTTLERSITTHDHRPGYSRRLHVVATWARVQTQLPPMPVSPPVSKVYQDQLTTLSHGLALWDPSPLKEIYDKVSIGDVGYLHEGSFIRMFNVMLPWSHESNRTLGEPEPYESLDCGPFANTFKRQFDRVKHYSHYVSADGNSGNGPAMKPDK